MNKQSNIPQPPKHGRVISSGGQHSMPAKGLKAHLAQLTSHVNEVAQYGGYEATGQSSQGGFAPGGSGGADYSTTSTGNTGDSDSGGPSGY
jgi:hypothetical protein